MEEEAEGGVGRELHHPSAFNEVSIEAGILLGGNGAMEHNSGQWKWGNEAQFRVGRIRRRK